MARWASVRSQASASHGAEYWKRLAGNRQVVGFALTLPLLALVLALIVYPMFYAMYLSQLGRDMTRFVGFENFAYLLRRSTFHHVVFQTTFFALSSVMLKVIIGFILAQLLHSLPSRGQMVWRALLLIAWVVPLPMSTLAWWWLFDPSYSAFNWILGSFGISPVPWLGDGWMARISTITVGVWHGSPFFVIMYLAALKAIPDDLYQSAALDGAGPLQRLFFITLPMMRGTIIITVLFSLILTFAEFDIIQILTKGGPRDMTHVFSTYSFQLGIQSGDLPLGAAISLFMLPILGVLTALILRYASRQTNG